MGPLKTKRKYGGWQAYIEERMKQRIVELERQAEYQDWQCPNCGWDSVDWGNPDPSAGQVKYRDREIHRTLDGEYYSWLERWTCPECGTVFECSNSN